MSSVRAAIARNARTVLFIFAFSLSLSGASSAAEEGTPPDRRHDPFTLYDADDGALEWDDMTPAQRATTDAVMDWAETRNGAAVHDAFSTAAARTSEIRIVEEAQNGTNLNGIETLGVVP